MQDAVSTIAVGGIDGRAANRAGERVRVIARNVFPFLVVGVLWEIVARAHLFPEKLFPTLESVAATFVQLTVSGILPHHAIETVIRLLSGFALAAVFGVVIGVLMGRAPRTSACRW
jgi:NitT/TauT family transport system permease protein